MFFVPALHVMEIKHTKIGLFGSFNNHSSPRSAVRQSKTGWIRRKNQKQSCYRGPRIIKSLIQRERISDTDHLLFFIPLYMDYHPKSPKCETTKELEDFHRTVSSSVGGAILGAFIYLIPFIILL